MDQFTWWQITLMIGGPLYLILCGGIGSYCSTERNRGGMEGFWFGVLLGPLGVVAAACMPMLEKVPAWPEPEEEVDVEKALKRAPR